MLTNLSKSIYSCILIYILCTCFIQAQGKFNLPKQNTDKIRFELINNLMVIPVEVNGVELSFLLDTGVSKPILFNIANSDSLQMNNVETIYVRGLGDGKPVPALRSQNNFFKIGNAININQEIYVVFDQSINFTPRLGIPVHGIIGYSLFKDFVVEINYRTKVLKLHKKESYTYRNCKKCETFNLSFYKNKPYINALATIGEQEVPVNLLIDTGSSDALWLFENEEQGITSNYHNYFDDFLGRGLSGNVHGKRSKITSFKLKGFELNEVNTAFPDSVSVRFAQRNKNRNGSLASEILKRFNVIFDYGAAKITLKKNANFNSDFSYNRSGIVLEQRGFRLVQERYNAASYDNYGRSNENNTVISTTQSFKMDIKPSYTIVEIRKGSPAERAGLLAGDVILSINGKDAHNLKLQDVIRYFRDRVGKTIKLKIDRNKYRMQFQFQLEDVFKKKELP
ncbi:aspartyl protease family protein [Psychroserpens sp.]|uniref:aspartyl protease family protein n=2 Tax=Psychroserpens sp. TaxID=2020870 RepID=UPI001B135E07|nr:aspartyl protease family protein [Psychroserpens sp.]MBO6605963.1 aspartyl protease family protein [Psychroserpens sp.]MBO6632024.1 aspartyl protease family protein [Psychroserpens sp.]MBO6652666.1 aspartyl protease family protein [Psychroserpens sp.]MBO6681562.1 aspartyl protease family protein [Psychroserpens sp.]MBO6749337.1 aspartyl protease family protein [Psychroserpens sp.]